MTALAAYCKFTNRTLEQLIEEAQMEESKGIPLKDRKIKRRLLDFRTYLMNSGKSPSSSKSYFTRVQTFYTHFEVQIPFLPSAQYDKSYVSKFGDLPTKHHIKKALENVNDGLKAVILFMSSSGTAKAESLSLTVRDFIRGSEEYHSGGELSEILDELGQRNDVVPTLYVHRIKTDKYYYTFCSPEASGAIVTYLKGREDLKEDDVLFDFNNSSLMIFFQEINDKMGWGFVGHYRFFRTHTLRKYHASNIDLPAEYIDALQGRSRGTIHETYIKMNPEKLKKIYMSAMHNVMIYSEKPVFKDKDDDDRNEFNIIINIYLGDGEYTIK